MATQLDVVVTMPAFNEQESIASFVNEIVRAFEGKSLRIVVVNDCSSDRTEAVLRELSENSSPVTVVTNTMNLGHGPSTGIALKTALSLDPKIVVATDGDGHVRGETLRELFDAAIGCLNPTVIEGGRVERGDPWFRRLASWATRSLVRWKSGSGPVDANTPFRVYPSATLSTLLERVPEDHLTPNLLISTLVRKEGIRYSEVPIKPFKREGALENGSTWKQRFRFLPSRRFLAFCWDATMQWVGPTFPRGAK